MPNKSKAKAKVTSSKAHPVKKAKKKAACPVFKVSKARTPEHHALLKQAEKEGHSLKGLKRLTDKQAIRRNRRRSQAPIRAKKRKASAAAGIVDKAGGPGSGYNYDEFPYASTHQGGTGATVKRTSETDNQDAGRDLGAFYKKRKIGEGDSFDISLTK